MEIKYKTGDFLNFVATRTFALGTTDVSVVKGSELEFDGSTVKYSGSSYAFPQLRAAVKTGWVILAENYLEGQVYDRPARAKISVRSAVEGKAPPQEMGESSEPDEQEVSAPGTFRYSAKGGEAPKARRQEVEPQDGVVVGRTFKTAAKTSSSVTAESVSRTLSSTQDVQIEAGQGLSEEAVLSRMSDEDRVAYFTKKQVLRSQYVDTEPGPPVVGRVESVGSKEAEGLTLTQAVGGGVETVDLGGTGGKAKESVVEEGGITFRTTNGPERTTDPHPREVTERGKVASDGTSETRLHIARMLCPEFPDNYDFSASERKKMARLQADFEDRPDVLRAVFAAETDEFKVKLLEEFPTTFRV